MRLSPVKRAERAAFEPAGAPVDSTESPRSAPAATLRDEMYDRIDHGHIGLCAKSG